MLVELGMCIIVVCPGETTDGGFRGAQSEDRQWVGETNPERFRSDALPLVNPDSLGLLVIGCFGWFDMAGSLARVRDFPQFFQPNDIIRITLPRCRGGEAFLRV